jgi:hypothetical protein
MIVKWAVAQMPVNLFQVLIEEKGQPTKSLCSDIVNVYFKALSSPAPRKA